eukprot:TRINITY_DN3144_c0_g1_i1.p1 TRINITY_DN3144_c0_g1~~TRINITY_DN3144_c0_g1_i1.p1  ORF type:complete len:122 (-),score=30.65 TRINITY_DN3144_c0_g1_i1:9-374(-)
MLYPRSKIVTYSSAYNIDAIDMVCIEYKNEEKLIEECINGLEMGFTGKQAIHPNQISPIYKHFCPSEETIDFAIAIVQGFEKHQTEGKGAFELNGKMIDMPMLLWAKRILRKANKELPQTL